MVIEAAFADSDGAGPESFLDERDITDFVEPRRVMWMHAGRREYEPGVVGAEFSGDAACLQRFTDTNNRQRARCAGARDYGVAVAGERRVREVGVAVDEDWRDPVLRGHVRSIQRSTGAAT